MSWFDAVVMAPLMAGENTLRVGQGPGMYTSIQAAVDAVEDPGENNPWTIVVGPGTYEEQVDLRDAVPGVSPAKTHVSTVLLPGAVISESVHGWVVSLNSYCGLYGGVVRNDYYDPERPGDFGDGVVTKYKTDPNNDDDPVRVGIRVAGVTSYARHGAAFRLLSQTYAMNCVARGGRYGYVAAFTTEADTHEQNTYLVNCVAIMERDPNESEQYESILEGFHIDWHGHYHPQPGHGKLEESGTVHFIRCVAHLANTCGQDGDIARGVNNDDGNTAYVASSFAAVLDPVSSNRYVYAEGARIGAVIGQGGQARIVDSRCSGVADPGSEQSEAKGLWQSHNITLVANMAASARAGRNTQVYYVSDQDMAVAPGGACVHLITPVSGAALVSGPFALLSKRALTVFDTDNGEKKLWYCHHYGLGEQFEWLTVDTA
jgi:hypothetical protein